MREARRIDNLTGFFVGLVLKDKPSRLEMAELLRGVRLMKRRLFWEDYLELSKRARTIVDIEVRWRERRDWEREMATMWGCHAN